MEASSQDGPAQTGQVKIIALVYVLQLAAFLLPLILAGALAVNYLKRRELEDTWLASHCRWQLRTAWFGLLWLAVGLASLSFWVGYGLLPLVALWMLYRIVRGWQRLAKGQPMYIAADATN